MGTSKKERGKELQAGKADKGYKGHIPSVEGPQNPGAKEGGAVRDPSHGLELEYPNRRT